VGAKMRGKPRIAAGVPALDLSELTPKIHATAMNRGFGSFVTTIFWVKE